MKLRLKIRGRNNIAGITENTSILLVYDNENTHISEMILETIDLGGGIHLMMSNIAIDARCQESDNCKFANSAESAEIQQ